VVRHECFCACCCHVASFSGLLPLGGIGIYPYADENGGGGRVKRITVTIVVPDDVMVEVARSDVDGAGRSEGEVGGYHKWTEEEKNYIVMNHGKKTADDMARDLGVSKKSILSMTHRLRRKGRIKGRGALPVPKPRRKRPRGKIKKKKAQNRHKWTPAEDLFIAACIRAGWTAQKTANRLGVDVLKLYSRIANIKDKTPPEDEQVREYTCDGCRHKNPYNDKEITCKLDHVRRFRTTPICMDMLKEKLKSEDET